MDKFIFYVTVYCNHFFISVMSWRDSSANNYVQVQILVPSLNIIVKLGKTLYLSFLFCTMEIIMLLISLRFFEE